MVAVLKDLTTNQLRVLAAQEDRSRTCAKAWVAGNEVPEGMESICEEAYRNGWFLGGIDNVLLVKEHQQVRRVLLFGFGWLSGMVSVYVLVEWVM